MADILQITLPDGTTYNIKDNNALPLTGGQVTGPVTFGDSVSIDDLTVGNIIVTGNTSFVQGIPWSTITGVPTTIAGYGITDAVTNVAYDSSTHNITKTINGTTSNVYYLPIASGTGDYSVIAGNLDYVQATGKYSFAGGTNANGYTIASGDDSFVWGAGSQATATHAVAFGLQTRATNTYSFAGGNQTQSTGGASFAYGQLTEAKGVGSFALGNHTVASGRSSMAIGNYNIEDTDDGTSYTTWGNGAKKYVFIVGNGTAENARSNALTVDWYGNLEIAGSITLGYGGNDATTLTAALLKVLISEGSAGQILTKTANGFEWVSLPNANGVSF